ncbi:protein of unknown function [Roseovarius azorensis]|uniref:Uncharacterized protein n=1 Tax=Roseovarius azorensis TaxID=1287727 RepID=A0A1H7G9M2_9RHOB|nr:DUF1833 family protein [Roseovarius azorensis]SEK34839.1 protein of unknown function [Roseovarius azorensis]
MPHPSIIASYAYATEDIEVATVEVRHPEITDPVTGLAGAIRLASIFAPPDEIEAEPFFEARLEAEAPLQAGQIVLFNRAPIEIVRPDKTAVGVPLARFRFSNVDARITAALIAASKTLTPVAITIRSFTLATRLSGQPEVLDGFELIDPRITAAGVEVTARAPDVINIPFHGQFYDTRFPLLGL